MQEKIQDRNTLSARVNGVMQITVRDTRLARVQFMYYRHAGCVNGWENISRSRSFKNLGYKLYQRESLVTPYQPVKMKILGVQEFSHSWQKSRASPILYKQV